MKSSEEIKKRLEDLKKIILFPKRKETIQLAIDLVNKLEDEVNSLWDMLEEIKKSDIENYKTTIETALAAKVLNISKKKRGKYDTN